MNIKEKRSSHLGRSENASLETSWKLCTLQYPNDVYLFTKIPYIYIYIYVYKILYK